jgi:tRNA (guanine10-N2)-methyltransferase
VFACEKDFDSLIASVKMLEEGTWKDHVACPGKTFKMVFDSFKMNQTYETELEKMKKFAFLPWQSTVRMKNPDFELHIIEEYDQTQKNGTPTYFLQKVFFARKVCDSGRHLLTKYTLKKRKYLGTTSMNETLSVLVANQALCKPNSFVLDPFVGTGSILISCMHFGARCLGFDIDWRVLMGKQYNMWSNVEQYNLDSSLLIDLVRSDLSLSKNIKFRNSLDAIVCDPPYGIRAGARKVEFVDKIVPEEFKESHITKTAAYDVTEILKDLFAFAAQSLCVGGRLIFWFPTNDDFKEDHIPPHECFKLLYNCPEKLSWALTRRLVTLEKISNPKI